MRRVVGVVCVALWAAGCGRLSPGSRAVSTPESFITTAYLAATGDADVCALAARRAVLPETRTLGAAFDRTLSGMRGDLAAVAQRRHIALPKGIEERKLALRDNLSILSGTVFDQGYALAMVQDSRAMMRTLDGARAIQDADVRNIVNKYRDQLRSEQRDSGRLLDRLGGAPWPAFEP